MHRRILHEVSMDYLTAERGIELALMRQCFAKLVDRAAHLLQCDGLEQDDAEIERWVQCGMDGSDMSKEVLVESLTDAARFIKPIADAFGKTGHSIADRDVRVVRLIARVVIDEGAPMSPRIPRT